MESDEPRLTGFSYPVDCPSPEHTEMGTTKIVWHLGLAPDEDTHTWAHALIFCWMKLAQHSTFGTFTRVKDMRRRSHESDPSILEVVLDFPRYGDDFYATLAPLLSAIDGWSRQDGVPIVDCSIAGDAYGWTDDEAYWDGWVDGNIWPYETDV